MVQAGGRRFVSMLASYVAQHEASLVRGKSRLSLSPPCIAYLNRKLPPGASPAVLASLSGWEEEGVLPDLEGLVAVLARLTQLNVEPPPGQGGARPSAPVVCDLGRFRSLRVLTVQGCAPSCFSGVRTLMPCLVQLSFSRTPLRDPDEALQFGGGGDVAEWPSLRVLRLSKVGLRALHSEPTSPHAVAVPSALARCTQLRTLDLRGNGLRSMRRANRTLGNLTTLVLRGNLLDCTEGLHKLYSLQQLDLSQNRLAAMAEVARLSQLPQLSRLWLDGNPVSTTQHSRAQYRSAVLALWVEALPLEAPEAGGAGHRRHASWAAGTCNLERAAELVQVRPIAARRASEERRSPDRASLLL